MTDIPDATRLVALVGSRIAHDLASPVGAIANGVELLGLTGHDSSPELALISESVANASLRIKLFRIAFGAAAPGQTVSAAEIAALTAPGTDGRKLSLDWQIAGDVPRTEAKLAFLALMCLEAAMPWGGTAQVTRQGTGLHIAASAERLNNTPALWLYLEGRSGPPDDLTAAQGRSLHVARDETGITITV